MLTNEELVDTLLSDLNSLLKNAASGQYIQVCMIVTGMSQKMLNLKNGIKKDIDNKNRIIETLKEHIRNLGEEVTDMSIEEYMKNHTVKDGADNGAN